MLRFAIRFLDAKIPSRSIDKRIYFKRLVVVSESVIFYLERKWLATNCFRMVSASLMLINYRRGIYINWSWKENWIIEMIWLWLILHIHINLLKIHSKLKSTINYTFFLPEHRCRSLLSLPVFQGAFFKWLA